jgi:hypothetical protein
MKCKNCGNNSFFVQTIYGRTASIFVYVCNMCYVTIIKQFDETASCYYFSSNGNSIAKDVAYTYLSASTNSAGEAAE